MQAPTNEIASMTYDAAVIGAGLAGLNCALTLSRAGLSTVVVEAADAPGGRIRTDTIDGFLLDRGFQVLLTAYPETQRVLDYPGLQLKELKPGALVWRKGRFHRFADPFREPLAAMRLAFDPVVTLGDKLRVAKLRGKVVRGSIADLFQREEVTTRSYLRDFGFSAHMIEAFFQPFFGGVFLETGLETSSRFFEFLFRMFSTGAVAVPDSGMEAIPRQLAAMLPSGTLLLKSQVTAITKRSEGFFVSAGNADFEAQTVVIAAAEPAACVLLQGMGVECPSVPRPWNSTTAYYFAADRSPVSEPILLLNGEGRQAGPVNNAVVLSDAAPGYAPAGAHLVSASVVGQTPQTESEAAKLEVEVREHLRRWFGSKVAAWKALGCRPVQQALPRQLTAQWEQGDSRTGIDGLFWCGDFLETSSIQGSLSSGRRAAESLLRLQKGT